MENITFNVEFIAHGFVPGKDISEEDWNKAISEYATMYEQYAKATNDMMDRLNETWNKYEILQKVYGDDYLYTKMMRNTMEISNETTYTDWLERWFGEVVRVVDMMAAISGFRMRGYLFRDGDVPVYGVKFKDKPEWTIDFVLKPVE